MCDLSDASTFPSTATQEWTNLKARLDRAMDGDGPKIQPTSVPPSHIHDALKYCFREYDRACQLQRCPMFKAQDLRVDLNVLFREAGDGPPFQYKTPEEVDLLTSDLAQLELCEVIAKVVYVKRVAHRIWSKIREVQNQRYEDRYPG